MTHSPSFSGGSRTYRKLDQTLLVRPEDALFDLCSMTIGGWQMRSGDAEIAGMISNLSSLEVMTGDENQTRLFGRRDAKPGTNRHTLKILATGSGEKILYPHPTFTGNFVVKKLDGVGDRKTYSSSWEALLHCGLNLNRSLQAQRRTASPRPPNLDRYALAISNVAASEVGERLLVPQDNIIARSYQRLQYAEAFPAEEHLRHYILAIFGALSKPLKSDYKLSVEAKSPTIYFRGMEVCWDFYDTEPILAVEIIKQKAKDVTRFMRARYWPQVSLSEGLRYDSPSVQVDLEEGVFIRIYAKSETTVRFEVVYTRDGMKHIIPFARVLSLDEAIWTAGYLKSDATRNLNRLFRSMTNQSMFLKNFVTVDELIAIVVAETTDHIQAKSVLTKLARNNRISPFPLHEDYMALRRLKKRGVLINQPDSPGRRNYVIAPEYGYAKSQLLFSRCITQRRVFDRDPEW